MHYFLVRYRLETIGMHATVLTVETGKRIKDYWYRSADTDTY